MTSKEIYDRFEALRNKSAFVMEGQIKENLLGNGIIVEVDLITSPAIKEILEEFEHVLMNDKGLNIFD